MSNPEAQNRFFCSQVSYKVGEQLFGTASKTNVWFLLEYSSRWGANAFKDSELSDEVKNYLSTHLKNIPYSRLQFIKNDHSTNSQNTFFFISISNEVQTILYRINLSSYSDLLSIDIPGIVTGPSIESRNIYENNIFLVCTNGKRDPCCAKFGLKVFQKLSQIKSDSVWQCSHVGGHRFAANVILLPQGILYGRIHLDDVDNLITSTQKKQVLLENLRGFTYYDEFVQVADYFLRKESGQRDYSTFLLSETIVISENKKMVTFISRSNGFFYHLLISREPAVFQTYQSCSDLSPKTAWQYQMDQYSTNAEHL